MKTDPRTIESIRRSIRVWVPWVENTHTGEKPKTGMERFSPVLIKGQPCYKLPGQIPEEVQAAHRVLSHSTTKDIELTLQTMLRDGEAGLYFVGDPSLNTAFFISIGQGHWLNHLNFACARIRRESREKARRSIFKIHAGGHPQGLRSEPRGGLRLVKS